MRISYNCIMPDNRFGDVRSRLTIRSNLTIFIKNILIMIIFNKIKFGIHKQHNKFPNILYYLKPRKLTINSNNKKPNIYKWLFLWFIK